MVRKNKKVILQVKGVDVKALRETLVRENSFISDVFDKLPRTIFTTDVDDSNFDEVTLNNKNPPAPGEARKTERARSLEELMSKLKDLQGKKPNYKNKLAKKGLKNKLKKKKKNEERNLSKKLLRSQKSNDLKIKMDESEDKKLIKPVKPVFNSDGKLVFSKFDFSDVGKKDKEKKEERDPKKILKQIAKQKEKIERLESTGQTEKVQELKEKQAWSTALKKAQGVKVKDDPELLKKSVKRLEQKKKHSAKKWKSREETMRTQQEERQKKRTQSIQQRKDQNKQTKMKKLAKKGRVMPGF